MKRLYEDHGVGYRTALGPRRRSTKKPFGGCALPAANACSGVRHAQRPPAPKEPVVRYRFSDWAARRQDRIRNRSALSTAYNTPKAWQAVEKRDPPRRYASSLILAASGSRYAPPHSSGFTPRQRRGWHLTVLEQPARNAACPGLCQDAFPL